MFGSSIGTLNIYVNVSGTETLVWRLSGNKGNQWKNGQVNVGKTAGSYKVGCYLSVMYCSTFVYVI